MVTTSFGNWQFERILGAGGFGQVELWKDSYTNRKIAIKKCMLARNSITDKQQERWKMEIENMNNFQHPNIVKAEKIPEVMEFDFPVLCMEFCNKGNLRRVLTRPENACGLLHDEVLTVIKDISSALKYLHYKTITHRDIKPENIVLHERNGMIIYKLIDLGYAKELGSSTTTASLVGTLNYVAPELLWKKKYSCSVDYWSMGTLFFEVVTGYKPFFPYLENIGKWMTTMKNKKYEQICAREINQKIQFYNNVIYCNDIEENTLKDMIKWFKVVLQWNPSQRGKYPGSDEFVVFPLLRELFPWKTISIFSVTLYRMDYLNITKDTTLKELQEWINTKYSIPTSEQLIVTSNGIVLDSTKRLPQNFPDSILYLYKKNSLSITDLDYNWNMPDVLDLMISEPSAIKDWLLLRQCYTTLIFIMKHEVALFKHYNFALSIKYDIINQKMYSLIGVVEKCLPSVEALFAKVNDLQHSIKSISLPDETLVKSINDLFVKVKSICDKLNGLKSKLKDNSDQIQGLFNSDKLVTDLQKYSQLFEEFLSIFTTFEKEDSSTPEYICDKVETLTKAFLDFHEQKEAQLQDPHLVELVSQLVRFESEIHYHMEVTNSCQKLIEHYSKKHSELLQKVEDWKKYVQQRETMRTNPQEAGMSLPMNGDLEIGNNIVLRALMDSTLKNMQEKLKEMSNFDMEL